MAQEIILLVPGIGLGGVELQPLARRLRRCGYAVETFWNNPWRRSLASSAERLRDRMNTLGERDVHLVAHSLGGMAVMEALRRFPDLKTGRIVTLGTPQSGCLAARRVARLPGGRRFLGEALMQVSQPGYGCWPADRQVGSIAGSLNLLLGVLLCPGEPNDTLVCVAETLHPDLRDHLTLLVSHTGMLVSRQVDSRIHLFVQTGSFKAVGAV